MSQWFAVHNETRQAPVAARVKRAAAFYPRLVGLLGRASLPQDEGLWLDPCDSIHMLFMRFSIDAIFLDSSHQVIRVIPDLKPWRMTRVHRSAATCLELAAGTAARSGTAAGDRLRFEPGANP